MITKPQTGFIKDPIFISYTSLSDFLKCPRSYYLKNIYKRKETGFRIQIASPHLSLGSTVHDSVKWYLEMGGQVSQDQLIKKFRNFWLKYSGKRGGFSSREEEATFGKRGLKMIDNFFQNAKILEKGAPAISFPKYPLFEDVILMGNFDFVGEREDQTLHVLDFKTGVTDEKDPIQLYIYAILAEANLGKVVSVASFWYLDRDDSPRAIVLDPLEPKLEWLKEKAKQLKQALEEGIWVCIKGEDLCQDCQLHQAIIDGKGEFQFSDYRYKKDVYYLGSK
ncbi:PD-(D/E)XK nuclease family protein [Candidatus Daviesbacteria bacterium]|nr:PD-(D/E)XK nuclease family protein [Candidatus Daviesbacteria bacterium]MBI4035324.1 PD-(D/E)XK nuclease family protein [Candidatus Daviesbacteria bacterium]